MFFIKINIFKKTYKIHIEGSESCDFYQDFQTMKEKLGLDEALYQNMMA